MAELLTEGSEAAVLLALPPCDHDVGDNDDEDDDYGDDIHHTYYDEEWVCLKNHHFLLHQEEVCNLFRDVSKKILTSKHYDPAC